MIDIESVPSSGDFTSIDCPNCDTPMCFVVPSPLPKEIQLVCSCCMGFWTLASYVEEEPCHLRVVSSGGAS